MKNSDTKPFNWAGMIFAMLIGGTLVWFFGPTTEKKEAKLQKTSASLSQRKQATLDIIKAGPKSTAWETPQGTVIALDIPKASAGGLLIEMKRCIVWRDAVTKTSSLQCDKDEIHIDHHSVAPPRH